MVEYNFFPGIEILARARNARLSIKLVRRGQRQHTVIMTRYFLGIAINRRVFHFKDLEMAERNYERLLHRSRFLRFG